MFEPVYPPQASPPPEPGPTPAEPAQPVLPAPTVYSPDQIPPQVPLPQVPTASPAPAPPPVSGPQESYAPAADPNAAQLPPDHPYAFITNSPPKAPRQPLVSLIPGGSSPVKRVLVLVGGLVIFVIIVVILKGLLSGGGPDFTPMVTVVQDQQEMIHLLTNAQLQQGLSANDQNLIATMQYTLSSSQAQTISYLLANHTKIKDKQLSLKISAATDKQLADAAAATTFAPTFHEVIQTQLTAYSHDLQQAYKLNTGKKGRALLTDSFRQAQLFQIQLDAASS